MNDQELDDEAEGPDVSLPQLQNLFEPEDPEFLARIERAIGHREAASAVGHLHSVGVLTVLLSFLETAFRVLFGDREANDKEKGA